ncbi:MAG: flavodoxin domain-containing protein, partial [Patescibacteria group bacterium]
FNISNITEIKTSKLKEYNSIILGASTWDGNLNPDADEFFNKLKRDKQDLSGINFALFGVGDNSYPDFCGAIDTIEKFIELYGGSVYDNIPKINSYWDININNTLISFAKGYLSQISNK